MADLVTHSGATERRTLIEDAALRLFAARGFAATTVDDIVTAAGLTKPMLYRHFESKNELFIVLLERSRDRLVGAPLAEFEAGREERGAQLARMIDAWLGHVEQNPDAARLLFGPLTGNAEVDQARREVHARQRATQVALLREFAPGLDGPEADALGEVVRAGFGAMAMWWLEHPECGREIPAAALMRLSAGIVAALEPDARRRGAGNVRA